MIQRSQEKEYSKQRELDDGVNIVRQDIQLKQLSDILSHERKAVQRRLLDEHNQLLIKAKKQGEHSHKNEKVTKINSNLLDHSSPIG